MIKVGTLVKFNPPEVFSASRDRYAKFGVVIGVKAYETTVHGRPDCYEVQWINGTTTNEHECYLKEVSIDNL